MNGLSETEFIRIKLIEQIKVILDLNPAKVGLYEDSYGYGLDMKQEALKKCSRELLSKCFQSSWATGELMISVVEKHFPEIEIIETGMSADETIILDCFEWLSQDDPSPENCFIFSSDTDLFTYSIDCSQHVYIVASLGSYLTETQIECYQLCELEDAAAIRELQQEVPQHCGRASKSPNLVGLQQLGFENTLLQGQSFILQTLLPVVRELHRMKQPRFIDRLLVRT